MEGSGAAEEKKGGRRLADYLIDAKIGCGGGKKRRQTRLADFLIDLNFFSGAAEAEDKEKEQ